MDTLEITEEEIKRKEIEEEFARLEEERITTINNFDRYMTIMEDYLTQRLISVLELNKENEGTKDIDDFIKECLKFGDTFTVKKYNQKTERYEFMSSFNANYSILYLLAGESQRKILGSSVYLSGNNLRVFRRTYFN